MNHSVAERISITDRQIAEVCAHWGLSEFALFGSVLRSDFSGDSDVDVLVEFKHGYSLDVLIDLKAELERLLGHNVDLIVKRVIEGDINPYRRDEILRSAQVIYRAR